MLESVDHDDGCQWLWLILGHWECIAWSFVGVSGCKKRSDLSEEFTWAVQGTLNESEACEANTFNRPFEKVHCIQRRKRLTVNDGCSLMVFKASGSHVKMWAYLTLPLHCSQYRSGSFLGTHIQEKNNYMILHDLRADMSRSNSSANAWGKVQLKQQL